MIESHRNKPGVTVVPSALPLHLATTSERRDDLPGALVSRITTLVVEERCATCVWPETCGADRTCWHLERDQAWERQRLDITPKQAKAWTPERLIAWVNSFVEENGRVPHSMDGGPGVDVFKRNGFRTLAELVRAAGHEPHRKRRVRARYPHLRGGSL